MYVYALTYRNPYEREQPFVLFLASQRLLDQTDAIAQAVSAVESDNLGHEWMEAVTQGVLAGPLEVDGSLIEPSIAICVE